MRTRIALVCWTVAAILAASPHVPAQQPPPPTYRSGIDLVTVDVTVLTRGGDPLTGLTADDFSVSVDGRPRTVVSVRLARVSSSTTAAPAPTATPAPVTADAAQRRVLILVVDRDNVPAGEGRPMLSAAATFVDGLPADDRVALWTLPSSSSALRFNENRGEMTQRLRMAVGTYRAPFGPWIVGRDEAIQVDDGMTEVLDRIIARECYRQPDKCPQEVENQARELARDARQRAEATLSGLGNLIDALAAVEGPKHLVLVTGGPVSTNDNLRVIAALGERAALARVIVHALQVSEPSYQARPDSTRAMPAEIDQTQSAAYQLAGTTGGMAITPTSGEIGFGRLSRELAAGYQLVFETDPADRDGKVHRIGVTVKNRGRGSSLRARKTFRVDPAAVVAPSLTGVTAPTTPPASAPPPESVGTDPGDMADRLADYAEAFERHARGIVADERFVQIIQPWRGVPSGPEKEPALLWLEAGAMAPKTGPIIARRQLVSDVLMAQLREQQWVSYRDVAEVDGQAVRDRTDRVMRLFLSQSPDKAAQFRRIASESTRYNLGDLRREINLPTIALSLLRRVNHPRFAFKRQRDETIDGRVCRVLGYREKTSPSLISTVNSGDAFIYGRIWIDQADGRVWRTELQFDRRVYRSLIRVDYGIFDGIDVLVPLQMWEWHEGVGQLGQSGKIGRGDLTSVQGLATYSKIRRFQVSTSEAIK